MAPLSGNEHPERASHLFVPAASLNVTGVVVGVISQDVIGSDIEPLRKKIMCVQK